MSDRLFDCCACCEPGGAGYGDHVEQGGFVDRDKHDGYCSNCQTPNGSPRKDVTA